ncbi:MAG: TlpA family protein disulfide reductase [Pirellulales bacterium]|nr:TlpA family protein disulfide reductase [Pirellulales bacterium]
MTRSLKYFLLTLLLGAASAPLGCRKAPEVPGIGVPDLQAAVDAHRGKVVLVDFWATWCPYCLHMFPHTVELQRRWADQGLAVITVNLDAPEDRSEAEAFLRDHPGPAQNFFSRWGAGRRSFEEFDLEGIPAFRVYGRDGKIFSTVTGAYPQDLDQAVEEALRQ